MHNSRSEVRNRDVPGNGWASRGEQPAILGLCLGQWTCVLWAIGEKFIEVGMLRRVGECYVIAREHTNLPACSLSLIYSRGAILDNPIPGIGLPIACVPLGYQPMNTILQASTSVTEISKWLSSERL